MMKNYTVNVVSSVSLFSNNSITVSMVTSTMLTAFPHFPILDMTYVWPMSSEMLLRYCKIGDTYLWLSFHDPLYALCCHYHH